MHKKSVIQQSFIYITVAIIVGVILIFGFVNIKKVSNKASKTELFNLENAIISDIELLSSEFGSIQTNQYRVPAGVTELCFVDLDQSISAGLLFRHPIIVEGIEEKRNLFVFDENTLLSTAKVSKLKVGGPGYVCYRSQKSKVPVTFKGAGDHVEISDKFEIEIAQNEVATFDFLPPGFSVKNLGPIPLILTVGISTSGISDEFNIISSNPNNNAGPALITFPLPPGNIPCNNLQLNFGSFLLANPDCTRPGFVMFDLAPVPTS